LAWLGMGGVQGFPELVDDRCPFKRPFPHDFKSCPAFEAIPFEPVDLTNEPLPITVTCTHLQVGTRVHGAFYPRCDLGGLKMLGLEPGPDPAI